MHNQFKDVCKFNNEELKHYNYFLEVVKLDEILLENVIVIKGFVFFFVNAKDYFKTRKYLPHLRNKLSKKVVIVRNEKNFTKMLFSFFPDAYIHDIKYSYNKEKSQIEVNLDFLTGEEFAIGVGSKGEYLKVVNSLFNNHIISQGLKIGVNIKLRKNFRYNFF